MTEKIPEISVIVCVLSINDKVIKCLESIAAQSYRNFELIVVYKFKQVSDALVCELFDKSIEIRTIQQHQGKLSDARNLGIESANAPYITFVDGDDLIKPSHLALLIENAYNDVDAIFSLPELIGNFSKSERDYFYRRNSGIYNSDLNFILSTPVVVWGKLFRRDVVERYDIRFPANVIFEDNYFHWAYLSCSKKVRVTEDKTYVYMSDDRSLMNSLKSGYTNEGLDNLKVLGKIVDFLLLNKKSEILTYKLFRKYYLDATKFIQKNDYSSRDKLMAVAISKLSTSKRLKLLLSLLFRGIPKNCNLLRKLDFCLTVFAKDSSLHRK